MSKKKQSQPVQKQSNPSPAPKAATAAVKQTGFTIRYPLLWLAVVVLVLYAQSFSFGLTELDDSIFIRDFRDYLENLQNLVTSFHRGLFDAVKDPYYRPLFMDSMIINYLWSDHGTSFASYHVLNVLFHIIAVLLLYKLFIKLGVKELHAFILSLLFAMHPVISQAVAWIPGRNDTMLAIFILSFLLFTINYTNSGKTKDLLLSVLFLILAFFTKETAVFAAPVAFVLLTFVLQKNWLGKRNIIQYCLWVICFVFWYTARYFATIKTGISLSQVIHDFIPRLPLIVQYLGKIFLPFNLSVFPLQQDTVYYYGIAAVVLLAAIIFLSKEKNYKIILSGLAVFLLFLLPVLLVPSNLNEQAFEHRLYLPLIGILLILPQTVLFKNSLSGKQLFTGGIAVAVVFGVINFTHQQSFTDPLTFWTKASESAPHSAYASMMLASRLDDPKRSFALFRRAYQLNPKEKYINYYYGVMLQKEDSVAQSEKYLLTEKNTTGYFECDFYLARIAMERKDFNGAINYLQDYIKHDPANKIANNNLLLLFLDTQQPDKAKEQVKHMRQSGLEVPAQILSRLGM